MFLSFPFPTPLRPGQSLTYSLSPLFVFYKNLWYCIQSINNSSSCFFPLYTANFFFSIWDSDFISFWYIPKSRIPGSYGSSISKFLKELQTVLLIKAKATKVKINKWNYIKLKSFCTVKGKSSKMKKATQGMGENVCKSHIWQGVNTQNI